MALRLAFNLPPMGPELRAKRAQILDDTDVLITHSPPHGILDRTDRGDHAGCELPRIGEVRPKVHVFGHIHEGYGTHAEGARRSSTRRTAPCATAP